MMDLSYTLNGRTAKVEIDAGSLLLDALRDSGALEVKEGCGVGVCGACSVLVDGRPVSSCLFFAACAEGAEVWTSRGLTDHDEALLEAFVAEEAMQCGICTPGQVVVAAALAGQRAEISIEEYLAGNLCRCTGYQSILKAVNRYLESHDIRSTGID